MENRAAGRDPTADRLTPPRSGLGPPSLVRLAFGCSAAIHLLAIVAYSAMAGLEPELAAYPFPAFASRPDGIEVIELVEVDVAPELQRPEDPRELARVEAPPLRVAGPSLGERPDFDLPAPGLTPAEVLRPRPTDRRLWAPLPPEYTELTLEQREELAVAGRLTAWQDSVNAAAAAAAAWTDWTFKDGDGGRWGFADGKLFLGDLAIPMPTFDAPYGQRGYMWEWNEIARQGAQGIVQESVRERLEAIRARRDQERARERADPQREPQPVPPDTTDNRR
jgi:hypothetical protein